MTWEAAMGKGEGERLHDQHRKRFWQTLLIAGVGGIPLGFAAGYGAGFSGGNVDHFWTSAPDWLILALLVISLTAILFGSWRFHRSVDELELLDNLWGSWAAYGIYALLLPTWWVLGKAGITREPNDWAIYFAALGGGLGLYLWRKWQAR